MMRAFEHRVAAWRATEMTESDITFESGVGGD